MILTLLKDKASTLLKLGIGYPLLSIVILRIFRFLGSSFIVL
jgi:hypothetical protein